MTQERKTHWEIVARLAGTTPLRQFAYDIRKMPITEDHIKGDVLIIGPGQLFPERLFIGTSESDLFDLRPQIETITVCDPAYIGLSVFFDPPIHIHSPMEPFILYKRGVNYMPNGFMYHSPGIPDETYDVVTFFRAPDTEEQLRDGMQNEISRILRRGSLFIGSGSFDNLDSAGRTLGRTFNLDWLGELPNPSDFLPFETHVGFIAGRPL